MDHTTYNNGSVKDVTYAPLTHKLRSHMITNSLQIWREGDNTNVPLRLNGHSRGRDDKKQARATSDS